MTFSIVARDPVTGDLGVAVASRFLAAGAVVPWARAGVGAVATQADANVRFGPDGLDLLAGGLPAPEVLERLVAADPRRAERQVGIVDAAGRAATHTGAGCFAWAGGATAHGVAVQGNILAGPAVVDQMLAAYRAETGTLPVRLLAALRAGDAAGGDRRGRQSAALLVVREGGGYGGANDRWVDLRVDDDADPCAELARLLGIHDLLFNRPEPGTLLTIDVGLAVELRSLLRTVDPASMADESGDPVAWDEVSQRRLTDWMELENLEERITAPGTLDPRVLDHLREVAGRRPGTQG
jgi:uncharacterized Ntn-hydrolase superfamily protein